jgi:hypothetical protein
MLSIILYVALLRIGQAASNGPASAGVQLTVTEEGRLVDSLMDPSSTPGLELIPSRGKGVARRLIEIGEPARTAIERAVESVEGDPARITPGTRWLLLALASIEREESLPRLQSMLGDRRFSGIEDWIATAIGLALRLTAYHSSNESPPVAPGPPFGQLPQNALDRFVAAWLKGDEEAMRSVVAPRGQWSLHQVSKERAEGVQVTKALSSDAGIGWGYRFRSPGPVLTFEVSKANSVNYQASFVTDADLFVEGKPCGSVHIGFVNASYEKGAFGRESRYLLDEDDLASITRPLSECIAHSGRNGDGGKGISDVYSVEP